MTLYSDRTAVYTGLLRDLTGLVAAGLALVLTASASANARRTCTRR